MTLLIIVGVVMFLLGLFMAWWLTRSFSGAQSTPELEAQLLSAQNELRDYKKQVQDYWQHLSKHWRLLDQQHKMLAKQFNQHESFLGADVVSNIVPPVDYPTEVKSQLSNSSQPNAVEPPKDYVPPEKN